MTSPHHQEIEKTHFFGDGCKPPHRCPDGTCQSAYNGVCKVCNLDMPKPLSHQNLLDTIIGEIGVMPGLTKYRKTQIFSLLRKHKEENK